MASAKKKIVIIDGMAYAFRAFYAVPEMSTSTGIATNALYGFIGAMKRAEKTFKPDYAVVAFDSPGGSFRDEMLKEYKGHRDAPPEQLVSQFPLIEQVVPLLGWHLLKQTRMEADDVMATITKMARKSGIEVIMMTSDKDMLQLVGDGVGCYRESFKGGSLYGPKEVVERFGINPDQVQDLLGLMGDSADNIPGVPGVGEKTATKLLLEYGTIEKVLKAAPKMKPGKLMENLQEFADQARLSYKLAALKDDVDLGVSMKDLVAGSPNFPKLLPLLKQYELRSLLTEYGTKATTAGHDAAELSAAAPAAVPGAKGKAKAKVGKKKLELRWKALAAASTADLKKAGLDLAKPVGIALHPALGGGPEAPTKLALGQEGAAVVLNIKGWEALHETLSHLKRPVLFDSKPLQRAFLAVGSEALPDVLDINVGGYLVNSTRIPRDLGEAAILMGLSLDLPAPQEDLFESPDEYLAKQAEASAMVGTALEARFKADDLAGLYEDLEGPLIPLLAKMENDGIALDVKMLAELEVEAQGEMKALHKKAIKAAGREFNLNSPSQLAEILFKELKLPPSKKTKTGYSTDNDVLEALAEQHPLPQLILDNRQLAKLSGTYLQALPRMVGADGRVHSNWNQTVAATGRLSSQDPNLQNIPVRTEWGSRIRKAFVPGKKGDSILTCDYSQIELRVLAHYCGDPVLKKAFQTGRDIHTETAARMFKVPTDRVTSEMRSRAKVINFGVLYGMGAFRISREFGTSVREGKSFLDDYFGQFPKVRAFLEECKEETRKHGYATTLLKRRRPIPEINSANRVLREQGERISTNMPIQGTAADMIKKAMLDVDALLKKKKARTRMLLQVHDELVFELAKEEADSLPPLIQKAMEQAMKLDVPIQVEMGQGRSWFDAKH
jgi:DNA polymerase-1